MRKRVSSLVLILLVAITGGGCRLQPVTSGQAPDFTLHSLDGGTITLDDLEGQVVVLDFWAVWCRPCVEAMPHLQRLHERYADQGVMVLAINVEEDRDEVAEFIADHGYTLTVLFDSNGRVADAYGVVGIPHTVVVDRVGEVHYVPGGLDDVEDALRQLVGE